MSPRRWGALFIALCFIAIAATARAGDETCRPEPVGVHTPSGVAGCTLDGPTDGVASTYPGTMAAVQWCVYPWTDCGSVRVQSHQTGLQITVPVGMFCDCHWFSDRRVIDLTHGQVLALGLNPEAGLFDVTVTPLGSAMLPDTAAP